MPAEIYQLLEIMKQLRTPDTGCPWDLQQDFASIAPYTIEEAYEVVDAIQRGDLVDLKDELGDLLLQVVFHAQIAQEKGLFQFSDVVEAICAKMIRRHPHVFGEQKTLPTETVNAQWTQIKAQEKAARSAARLASGYPPEPASLLNDVPVALPGLARAIKLQDKASTVGFDWNDPREVLKKIREEIDEIEDALNRDAKAEWAGETGDLLFAVANLARHLKIDPDAALRLTNEKFIRRFQFIESQLKAQGEDIAAASLDDMENLWTLAKKQEKSGLF